MANDDLCNLVSMMPRECGQVWHDIACYHKKWFVCEDSDKLMDFAKQTSPEHAPRI